MSSQARVLVLVLAWVEQQWAPTAMAALAEVLSAQDVAEAAVVVAAIMAGEGDSSGGSHTERVAFFDAQLACPVQDV